MRICRIIKFTFIVLIIILSGCQSYYESGVNKYIDEQYETAIVYFSKAIKIDPSNDRAYWWRGLAEYKIGNLGKAIGDIEMAIKLNDNELEYYIWGSYIYTIMDRNIESVAILNKCIEVIGDVGIIYYYMGEAYRKNECYHAALDAYSMAIELEPFNYIYYFARSEVKVKLLDDNGANEDYEKGKRLDNRYIRLRK